MGRSGLEVRVVARTVQHAHGVVTPRARLWHSHARPARCSPRVKFYQRSVPVEQGVPSGGWVTDQELSSLEPVQSQVSGGRRNNPMEKRESTCFRETLGRSVLGSHCPGNV